MDLDNYLSSVLDESSATVIESAFLNSEWNSVNGLSVNVNDFAKDVLFLKEDEKLDDADKKNTSVRFSQKIHSKLDESKQRKKFFFSKLYTTQFTKKHKTFNLSFLKNNFLEENALENFLETSLPGMNPNSSWPVCLNELSDKISKIPLTSLFHQPFDLDDKFQNEAFDYIEKSLKNELFIEHLPLAVSCLLSLFLLNGNTLKMKNILAFLKRISQLKNFDKVFFEASKLTLPILNKIISYCKSIVTPFPILKNFQLSEAFIVNKNNLYISSKYSFYQCSSSTSDGTYIYIILSGIGGSMMKIGTGLNDTEKGKVYLCKPLQEEEIYKWVFLKGKLYSKIGNSEEITVFDTNTFEKLGRIKLLFPETIKHQATKKYYENFTLLTDGERLLVVTIEPVLNENPKTTLPSQISSNYQYEEIEISDKEKSNVQTYDNFTHLNLVLLTYNVHSMNDDGTTNKTKINSTISKEKQDLINELHESFSFYFTYENCHRALAMFNWKFDKAALYLIDNSEQVNEEILIAESKEILYSASVEKLLIRNGALDFKLAESVPKEIKECLLNPTNLKWVSTTSHILAYKSVDGECYVFDKKSYLGKYPSIQLNKIDYLVNYDIYNGNYYFISNFYSYISQRISIGSTKMEEISELKNEIQKDFDLSLSEIKEGFDLNFFTNLMDKLFINFSLSREMAYWRYSNWNAYYTNYYEHLVLVRRELENSDSKKYYSMLKTLIHKMEKFSLLNKAALLRQLSLIFPDIHDYDLELEGKFYRRPNYDKVPTTDKANWTFWNYNQNVIFVKKKNASEKPKKDPQKDAEKSPQKEEKISESISPNIDFYYMFLENKLETFFGYEGTMKTIETLLSSYDELKEKGEKQTLIFLYKVLLFIENFDFSIVLESYNKTSLKCPITTLETLLKDLYSKTSSGKVKSIIEAIIVMGWEIFSPDLESQLRWFKTFQSAAPHADFPKEILTNTSKKNIYRIITKKYPAIYVLMNQIYRINKSNYFPISSCKINSVKTYVLGKFEDKILGITSNTGISSYNLQTPFYYSFIDNETVRDLLKRHKKKPRLTIFKLDKIKRITDFDNLIEAIGVKAISKSRAGFSLGYEKKSGGSHGSCFLENNNSSGNYFNQYYSLEELFQVETFFSFKNFYNVETNVKESLLPTEEFFKWINEKEENDFTKEVKYNFLVNMEYGLFSELMDFQGFLLPPELRNATSIFSNEDDEEEEQIEGNGLSEEKKEEKKRIFSKYTNEMFSMLLSRLTFTIQSPSANTVKKMRIFRQSILFNFLISKLSSVSMNKVLEINQALTKLISKPKEILTISSNGFQLEKEKVFEYTLSQGEYLKICEIAEFKNALAVIVEIEMKCSNDNKPNFDLIIVSKTHPYNKSNTNNNFGNFGTCFSMKLSSLAGNKLNNFYILLGDEIKVMTNPDSSFRPRHSNNANNGPKSVNKLSKGVLKIRCYPYCERSYCRIHDDKIDLNLPYEERLNLSLFDDMDYYSTLINKFLLRSIPIGELEKDLMKSKPLLSLSKNGLFHQDMEEEILKMELEKFSYDNMTNILNASVQNLNPSYDPKINSYMETLKQFATKLDENDIEFLKELSKDFMAIKNHIREIVPEPRNYQNLKRIPSFNENMKMFWNLCEILFMLSLFYHLNIIDDFEKIKDEDFEPFYLEYVGKKLNSLVSWMTGRVQYLKDTFDNVKNYSELIITMNNDFIENIRKLVLEKIKFDHFKEEEKEDKKDEPEKKSKGKTEKDKKDLAELKRKKFFDQFVSKDKNYKKKANVSRLYVELPKTKKKKKEASKKEEPKKEEPKEPVEKDEKKKLTFEEVSKMSLKEILEKYPQYKSEFVNGENIKKLKEEISQKIEADIKESYFGNVEKLKSVCEVYDITFSESNLTEALKSYTSIIKRKLSSIYDFSSTDKVTFIDPDQTMEKIYSDSPYKKLAITITEKLIFILQLKNDPSLNIRESNDENQKSLALTFARSKISEISNTQNEDIDAFNTNISKSAQNIVKNILLIITKSNLVNDSVALGLYIQDIRNIIRKKGLGLLCDYYNTHGDLFSNSFGMISCGVVKCNHILTKDILFCILDAIVGLINKEISMFNLDFPKENGLTKKDYEANALKNLNLILNDINTLLLNGIQDNINCDFTSKTANKNLNDIKSIIRKALNIIINDENKFKSEIVKFIHEFILNFRLFLSYLVKLNIVLPGEVSVTSEIIESLIEALDRVTDYDKNVNLISSLLDIIYHIVMSVEGKEKNDLSFRKGFDKLLNLILNSTTPTLVSLSAKIAKIFSKNSEMTKMNLASLFKKLGRAYNMDCIQNESSFKGEKYNILIEMNSPEIDYQFLVNVLFHWEEEYPTIFSTYKTGVKPSKENEIKIVTPPGKEISHFIPLKVKATKTHELEQIIKNKINSYKDRITYIQNKIEGKEEEKKEEKKKDQKEQKDKKDQKEQKDKPDQKEPEKQPKKQLTPQEIEKLLKEIDLINVKIRYLNRIQEHIKLCYKIGECASTRGYVIIDNKFSKAIAEKFAKLIMSGFYDLIPQIPSEEGLNINGMLPEGTKSTPLFNYENIHPPLFKMNQLLPGCTNILKEITKPYISCLLVEATKIYPLLYQSITSFSFKTNQDNSLTQTQSKSPSSFNITESSQHIIDNHFISGESITCIMDYICDLISFSLSQENSGENENYIKSMLKENSDGESMLGILIYLSGGVNIIRQGVKCLSKDGKTATVINGGYENGMKSVNVIFDNGNNKVEKVSIEKIEKCVTDSKLMELVDLDDLIDKLIQLHKTSEKSSMKNNLVLYMLKLIDRKLKVDEEDMQTPSKLLEKLASLQEIVKEISKSTNWISTPSSVLEQRLITAFERKLTSTSKLIYEIYSPSFNDLPNKEIKTQIKEIVDEDLITNYTLPYSSFVTQLPIIEDNSKSCLALKNISQFERYTVEEIFNYAKSHYRDHEYLFYLRQVRQELSFNDIQNAKNDIYIIFDQNKVPPGMPLPQEHRDMKEIFKEECYCNNYYLAKMTPKLIRDSGIKSLLNDTFTKNESTVQQSSIKEIPVLVLILDNLIGQAFVMYNDYIYCNIHTFWISVNNLCLLDFNMKLPPSSISQPQLEENYKAAYDSLLNHVSKSIQCSIYEKMLDNFRLNDIDNMTNFINLALWSENINDPIDGVMKKFKNFIQIRKKENFNIKKYLSSRHELTPSNSEIYQSKRDINHIISHLNKANSTGNFKAKKGIQLDVTTLSKIQAELNENDSGNFSLETLTQLCINKIKLLSKNLKCIKVSDLAKEYHNQLSKNLFTIATMGNKLLSLHSLSNIKNVSDYCGCIISFEQSGKLGPNAKMNFYGDENGQNLLRELSSPKTSRTEIESVFFPQSEIYMEYVEGTTAFYINDWDTQSRDSILPCSITYIPYDWPLVVWLIDYCSSSLFEHEEISENEKIKTFQKIVKELLVFCNTLNIPAEFQQNIFNITNRVILKAVKFASISKIDKKKMTINEKFELIGFDEISVIGIIKNIDNCLSNKQQSNFNSSYIVDQVEILVAILSFIQESYLSLENYLREVFDYSLPLWIEAIMKLGSFLAFLQGSASLDVNLINEIKEQINTVKTEENVVIIKNTVCEKEAGIKEIQEICRSCGCRIVNVDSDIQKVGNCFVFIFDGFNVEELKEIPEEEEEEVKKPQEEVFWFCSCGFENAMENEYCCACDKEKPEIMVEEKKKTTKKVMIKNEAYTLKVEEMKAEMLEKISKSDSLFLSVGDLFEEKSKKDENKKGKKKDEKKDEKKEKKEKTEDSKASSNKEAKDSNASKDTQPKKETKDVLLLKDFSLDVKENRDIINSFLLQRLTNYVQFEEYYTESLLPLTKLKNLDCSIILTIKKHLSSQSKDLPPEVASFNFIKFYEDLKSHGIDIYHSNTALTEELLMSNIDINLMESIRELIDMRLCKETKISYVYPTSSIRFVSDKFKSINHSQISIIQNYYKNLIPLSLIQIKYYWAIIRYFNVCLVSAIPFIKPPEIYMKSFNNHEDNEFLYISFPKTISMFLSSAKGITFATTKSSLLNDVLSFTEFSPEEVQIPTFKFERLNMANKISMNSLELDPKQLANEESMFLQAYEQGKDIDPAFFRSSKVPGDPHMGFKVEFKGEMVQGLGGPYRQFFSDVSGELIPADKNGRKLNLFCPTKNNVSSTGEFKDKYTITPSSNSNLELNHYEFLGMLFGVCIRTGVHIPLELCSLIWKKITDTAVTLEDIKEFDEGIIEQINFLSEIDNENFDNYNLNYSCELSDGTLYDLIPNGKYEPVQYDDLGKYMELLLKARLTEMDKQISYIKKGLYKLIPPSLIKLLTYKELERLVSGCLDKDIDVELLKANTKYTMNLSEKSNQVKWLWEILNEFTPSDKRKFIKFCWAQERLPSTKEEYERLQVVFTIKPSMDKNRKDIFPKADTCFFALELPNYTSKEIMKNKILTAIHLDNVSINADKVNVERDYDNGNNGYAEDFSEEDDIL